MKNQDKILDAAAEFILEEGIRNVTYRSSALISLFSDHPEIMVIWKGGYGRWQQHFEQDHLDWEKAAAIRFVCDGL